MAPWLPFNGSGSINHGCVLRPYRHSVHVFRSSISREKKREVSRSGESHADMAMESVLRYGHTDNPLGSSIAHSYRLHILVDLGKGRAVGRDSIDGAATTVSVVEFKVLNVLALAG
jgi:hypothetical protein